MNDIEVTLDLLIEGIWLRDLSFSFQEFQSLIRLFLREVEIGVEIISESISV